MSASVVVLALLLLLVAAWAVPELRRRPMGAKARAEALGEFAAIPGGRTHFRWFGPEDGPVVVCVHGLVTPSPIWEPMASGLAMDGYRVLTYDLWGRGYSARPLRKHTADLYCRQLSDLLDSQGVTGPVSLLGYSMGAAIATTFAAATPSRVDRLVLLAPGGLGCDPGQFFERCCRLPVVGDIIWGLHGGDDLVDATGPEERFPALPALIRVEVTTRGYLPSLLSSGRNMLAEDQAGAHKAIATAKIPVRAIWGRHDRVIPLSALGRLAQLNRNAQQSVLEAADHGLIYTHASECLKDVRAFLKR
ncbi:alpha-beta hydrolase superfamily lysophospholipase [Aliiruegeria haliotis]|uniref:Alpha-beta hydrolase superfamily lysophospholipase n=1 Tax=Aliiruegeria haliotis TaxID=1280846 RepID=A0A2T0RSU9_9RHOB|nr:alpha/beta fold hydrolase [Aliiruegeria haliotis]PRY24163.1 alpha-beta hydrolase superfamily lysophospholipase [Aliiruegeria haliotis]